MSNIATNIEQSKHLLELGLSPDSADMEYCYINEFNSGLQVKGDINAEVDRRLDMMFGVTHIPAWSLTALLDVLPLGTEMYKMCDDDEGVYYEIDSPDKEGWTGYEDSDPITAAYEMVCWLLEQGLIEKGGQDERD